MGANWNYTHPSEIIDEIARLTPTFAGFNWDELLEIGSVQWPVNEKHPEGSPVMHVEGVRARQGQVRRHRIHPDRREDRPALSRCC